MPILHLPVQSGSDKILKLMNRKHDIKHYLLIIEKIKKINKKIKFSSDFIIGYPGETDKDFQDTIDLIKEVGFVNSYSFIYSPRSGTPASLKKVNNLSESKERLKEVQNILLENQIKNNKTYIDKNCEVLVENKLNKEEKYFGRTKYMTPVKFESSECKIGEIVDVKILSFNKNGLFGYHKSKKEIAA